MFRVALFAARISRFTVLCTVDRKTSSTLLDNIVMCPSAKDNSTLVFFNQRLLRLAASKQESSIGLFGCTNSSGRQTQSSPDTDVSLLSSKICDKFQCILPHATVCTIDDMSKQVFHAVDSDFHFTHLGNGTFSKLVIDKMFRRMCPFSLLMLNYLTWDAATDPAELLVSFVTCLRELESRNLFTPQSVAVVSNIADANRCLSQIIIIWAPLSKGLPTRQWTGRKG
jgi:hypothetical protein